MAVEVKFCGITRLEDAAEAVRLGAHYVGVIFAGGPRQLTPDAAAALLEPVAGRIRRVGVMGTQPLDEIVALSRRLSLDTLQLHAARTPRELLELRAATGCELWAVVGTPHGELPGSYGEALRHADGVVLDSMAPGQLGGSGFAADWAALARSLAERGRPERLILAGGLRPENVERARAIVRPDVVDVSSGVESAPGRKDPLRMAAFCAAVGRLPAVRA